MLEYACLIPGSSRKPVGLVWSRHVGKIIGHGFINAKEAHIM